MAMIPSCSGGDEPGHDPRACTSFIVPDRFGLRWKTLNHRVSLWQVRLAPRPGEGCRADTLDTAFIGGDFSTGDVMSDIPRVTFGFQAVDAETPVLAGAARLRIQANVGPEGVVQGQESLDRDQLALTGYEFVTAFVEGLSLATDVPQGPDYPKGYDPAHGYTSRGIGAWVDAVQGEDGGLVLDWRVRFAHGTSDRKDMNAAMAQAVTGVTLDVLLVGVSDRVPIHGLVDYTVVSPLAAPLDDVPCLHPPVEETRVTLAGSPGPWQGFYGITGFEYFLEPPEEEGAGYYLRDLDVSLTLDAHDPATGEASFDFEGYASNASGFIVFYAMSNHFRGAMAWVPASVQASHGQVSETFTTGAAEFDLP